MLQSSQSDSQMAFNAALEEHRLLIDRELPKELIQDDIADLNNRTSINLLALAGGYEVATEQLKVQSQDWTKGARSSIERLKDSETKELLIDLADSVTSLTI